MRLLRVWSALACAGVLVAVPASAGASLAAKPPTPAPAASTSGDLAETTAALAAATTALRAAQKAMPAAEAAVAQTQSALAEAQRAVDVAVSRRGNAQVRLMLATQAQEQTADVVSSQQARITQLVRAAYVNGGDLTEMSAVLDAESPEDFAQRLMSYRAVSQAQQAELQGLQVLQSAIAHDASGLATLRGNLAVAQSAAEAQLAGVARAARAAQTAQAALQTLIQQQSQAMADAQAALAEDAAHGVVQTGINTRLQSQLAEQARQLLGAAGARPGSSYVPVPGTLAAPAVGPITSPFGMRKHPITGVYKLHTGTDFGVPCGTVVQAARAGTVIQAYVDPAYGLRTVISHGVVDGALLTTTYNHQSRIDVQVGQTVNVGDPIGLSGTTGYSTGCHLHFELLVNADFVDPVPWM